MKRIIIICFTTLLFASCNMFVGVDRPTLYHSFITEYYDITDINLSVSTIAITIKGVKGETWTSDTDKYKELRDKHGDTLWNARLVSPPRNIGIGVDWASIHFVSDADFDETHLAGEPLDDVIELYSTSWYLYIKSGHDGHFPPTIYKFVSELTTDEMAIMEDHGDIATVYIMSEPTLSQVHNITVTMTADDGRVFEKTVQVSWE